MNPTFITKTAFQAVGLAYHGINQSGDVPRLWEEFLARLQEINGANEGAYGLCLMSDENGMFSYLASKEVSGPSKPLPGMEIWQVPEQLYAVFPCRLSTIRPVCEEAFEKWLPQSEYEYTGGTFFEYYGREFDPAQGRDSLKVYIPVRKKGQ